MKKYLLLIASSLFLAFLLIAPKAHAAIALDATSTASSTTNITSLSWPHTVGSGSNRILLVAFGSILFSSEPEASSVTYGGVSLTNIFSSSTAGGYVSWWYLINPTTGTATTTITFKGSSLGQAATAIGVSLTGVNQSTPIDATSSNTAACCTVSTIIPVHNANEWALVNGITNGGAFTASSTQTVLIHAPAGGSEFGASYVGPVSANTTVQYSTASAAALGGISVEAAASSPSVSTGTPKIYFVNSVVFDSTINFY